MGPYCRHHKCAKTSAQKVAITTTALSGATSAAACTTSMARRLATASATSPAWETAPRCVAAGDRPTPPLSTRSEVVETSNQQPKHPPSPPPKNPLPLLLLARTISPSNAAPNATPRRNAPKTRTVQRNARRPAVSAMMALSTLGQLALVNAPAASITIARFWTSPCSSMRPRGPDHSQLTNVLNGVVTAISVMILRAAAMTTNLAWGAISFLEGYNNCGELEYIKKTIKWSTDYMIDANRLPIEFIGQIGNGDADHNYWGRPEDMNMNRPVMSVSPSNPGSDLAGESAAALASASIFYKMIKEPSLAAEALDNAKELYEFAETYKGKYSDSIWDASKFYNSWSGYEDELAWGAARLYKATEDPTYLEKAKKYFNSGNMCESNLWFGWDNKKAGVEVLMYDITGQDPAY